MQLKAAKARQKDPRVTTPDLLAAEANLKLQREALNTLEWERDKKLLDTEWEREAGMDPGVNYAVAGADKEDNTFKVSTASIHHHSGQSECCCIGCFQGTQSHTESGHMRCSLCSLLMAL